MTDTIEITVRLVGGPPDWAGKIVSAGPGSTGIMPISDCTPWRDVEDDPAPRAVYEPDPDHPNSGEWHFQGWFPATSYDPRPVDYLALPHEVVAAALAAADLALPDSVAQQITVGLVDTITPVEELAATPREELVQELAGTIVRVADDHLRTVPPAAAAAAARRLADHLSTRDGAQQRVRAHPDVPTGVIRSRSDDEEAVAEFTVHLADE